MLYLFLYKLCCLGVGFLIVHLGYRLFLKGIFNESGEVEGNWKDFKLMVRKAAPGTYFVLFGSAILAFAVFKGFEITETESGKNIPHSIMLMDSLAIDSIHTHTIDTPKTYPNEKSTTP